MTSTTAFVLVSTLLAASACKRAESTPTNSNNAPQPAVAPVAPAPKTAPTVAPAAKAKALATRLGPIDLTKDSFDIAKAFPGSTQTLSGGAPPTAHEGLRPENDEPASDYIRVDVKDETVARVALSPGGNVDRIQLFINEKQAAFEATHPDLTCEEIRMLETCVSPHFPHMRFSLDRENGVFVMTEWVAPEDKHFNVATTAEWTPEDRPMLIDRCTRLYVITRACGFIHSSEFGWMLSDPEKTTKATAKRQCKPSAENKAQGLGAYPVPLYDELTLGQMESASNNCAKLRTELEKYGTVGDPSGEYGGN